MLADPWAVHLNVRTESPDWTLARLPRLSRIPGLVHAMTTALDTPPRNLHADCPTGLRDRRQLAEHLGLDGCAWARQVHGGRVVTADEAGQGRVEADGLITDRPGVGLLNLSADCPIILASDVKAGAVGVAHASWRSTVQRIAERLIEAMAGAYGCEPGRIVAGISPSAGPCCYEVGEDVREAAIDALGPAAESCFAWRDGGMTFDLWRANVQQLTRAGLSEQNIEVAGVCTITDTRFYSYRRQGAAAGRIGCLIARTGS